MKIEEVDANFKTETVGNRPIVFRSAVAEPFQLEGLPFFREHHRFNRFPETLTSGLECEGIFYLAKHTSGAAVRFRTDSPVIALRAELSDSSDMNHMPRTGSAGFDLYSRAEPDTEYIHAGTLKPNRDQILAEELCVSDAPAEMRDWIVNFPLYGGLRKLEIGLAPDAKVCPPSAHKIEKPILFYGSSITQGACASRPGNAYSSMLCRAMDAEQINFGFSGSARGEQTMAALLADLDFSVFIYDYDHNAPNVEHLRKTHEPFFRTIREKHPDTPVIILSKCDLWRHRGDPSDAFARRDIVRATYEHARNAGDAHVCFIDGETLFGTEHRTDCTVDGCHPNDLGFHRMFETVLPVLRNALSARARA